MSRADFWCRVLGWLQLIGGAVTAGLILFLWELIRQIFMIAHVPALSFLVWVFVVIVALPGLLAGLFTVLFANAVEQPRDGFRGPQKIGLRILMALSGLWSAGVIGTAGFSFPPLGFFAILALITVGLAVMGPDWTADLFKRREEPA